MRKLASICIAALLALSLGACIKQANEDVYIVDNSSSSNSSGK